jgi:hypothetical protein
MPTACAGPGRKQALCRIVQGPSGTLAREEGPKLAGGDDDLVFIDLAVFPKIHEVRMRDSRNIPSFCGAAGVGEAPLR